MTDTPPRCTSRPAGRIDGVAVAAGVLAISLLLLGRWGVLFTPDSLGFIGAAEALGLPGSLLDGTALATRPVPVAFYRPPLYPLLILAARGLAGSAWAGLLVAAQLAAAAAATIAFHGALLRLTRARLLAALGALAQATGFALATHIAILADSLYASLLCLAFSMLTMAGLGSGLTGAGGLLVGGLLGTGTLLREVGAYTGLLWLPLIAVAAAPGGRAAMTRAIAAALLPMLGAVLGLLAWNLARSGQAFLTTVGQVVYFQALLPLARAGLPVFAGDPALASAAADSLRGFEVGELQALNIALFTDAGLDAVAIARLAARTWRQAWIDHPQAMAVTALRRIKAHHLLTLFLPLENAAQVPLWAEERAPLLARFDRLTRAALGGGAPGLVALWLLALLCRLVAAGMAAAFLLAPLLAMPRAGRDRAARLALAAWPVLPGTVAVHALVHLEVRYFAPAMPLAIAAAMWCTGHLIGRMRRRDATAHA